MKKILFCILLVIIMLSSLACRASNTSAPTLPPENNTTTPVQNTTIATTADPTVPTTLPPEPTTATTEPAHIHQYTLDTMIDPTCTQNGQAIYICPCGAGYAEAINPIGHNHTSQVVSDPTCDTQGVTLWTCHCGDNYTTYIDALGHNWGTWYEETPSTLTTNGFECRMCSICRQTETQLLPLNTIEQEIKRYTNLISGLPEYDSVDQLSAGFLFDWLFSRVDTVADDWNEETCEITRIYSIDALDAFTTYYLGTTFDYLYFINANDHMEYDAENHCLIWHTYGAGGGYEMAFVSYEQIDETHYVLHYSATDMDEETPAYYGTLTLCLEDQRFIIESHKKN